MVRRVVLTALAAVVTVLSVGCAVRQENAPPAVSGFSCDVEGTYQQMRVAGRLSRASAGTLRLEFTEPESLKGLSAVWDGETVSLKLFGISFEVPSGTLPESALGNELVAVFDAALRGEGEARVEEDITVYEGSCANGNRYTLTCDNYTGAPLSLSVPQLPLEVAFSDFLADSVSTTSNP